MELLDEYVTPAREPPKAPSATENFLADVAPGAAVGKRSIDGLVLPWFFRIRGRFAMFYLPLQDLEMGISPREAIYLMLVSFLLELSNSPWDAMLRVCANLWQFIQCRSKTARATFEYGGATWDMRVDPVQTLKEKFGVQVEIGDHAIYPGHPDGLHTTRVAMITRVLLDNNRFQDLCEWWEGARRVDTPMRMPRSSDTVCLLHVAIHSRNTHWRGSAYDFVWELFSSTRKGQCFSEL